MTDLYNIKYYNDFMTRPLRIEFPGAVYHITSRGNEKQVIFLDDKDRDNFLIILSLPGPVTLLYTNS